MGLIYQMTKGLPSGGLLPSTLEEFLEKAEKMKIKNGHIEEIKINSAELPTWGPADDEDGLCGWNVYPAAIEFALDYTAVFANKRKLEFTESLPIYLGSVDPARINQAREKQRLALESRKTELEARNYQIISFVEYPALTSRQSN